MKYSLNVYKDRIGEWRWNLRARNGRIVADSGEGYKRKDTMMKTVERLFAGLAEGSYIVKENTR